MVAWVDLSSTHVIFAVVFQDMVFSERIFLIR